MVRLLWANEVQSDVDCADMTKDVHVDPFSPGRLLATLKSTRHIQILCTE